MLIFNACDGEHNIIQFVLGPQTQLQLDMMGVIKLDLDKLLSGFESDLPFKLVVTRSDNEQKTLQRLQSTSGSPPFPPSFFTKDGENNMEEPQSSVHEEDYTQNESQPYEDEDPRGQYVKELVCPGCKSKGVYLKKDMPPYCADCLKIELGLGNIKEPVDVPEEEPKKKTKAKTKKKTK